MAHQVAEDAVHETSGGNQMVLLYSCGGERTQGGNSMKKFWFSMS